MPTIKVNTNIQTPNVENCNVGNKTFMVEPFDCDYIGRIRYGVLGNYLLNCASSHAADHGFGLEFLNSKRYTWVLSQMSIKMSELPEQYDTIVIETWVDVVKRFFTRRNFKIWNPKSGLIFGYATSLWAMINIDDRKAVDLMLLHEGALVDCVVKGKECPIEMHHRIKVDNKQAVKSLAMTYSDIDINGHVNSFRYIDHILDLFSIERYKTQFVKRLNIDYLSETFYGDELQFFVDKVDENTFHIELHKQNGDIACRASTIFGMTNQT
jgi:medium-chain acyl-[acyl-carrier-protein] hydrolase